MLPGAVQFSDVAEPGLPPVRERFFVGREVGPLVALGRICQQVIETDAIEGRRQVAVRNLARQPQAHEEDCRFFLAAGEGEEDVASRRAGIAMHHHREGTDGGVGIPAGEDEDLHRPRELLIPGVRQMVQGTSHLRRSFLFLAGEQRAAREVIEDGEERGARQTLRQLFHDGLRLGKPRIGWLQRGAGLYTPARHWNKQQLLGCCRGVANTLKQNLPQLDRQEDEEEMSWRMCCFIAF